jgi:pyruvate/2-oxoglutarate dehydrogenase complex dihydrolipoamide dehydrogenase (E3) component/uncharacterized membrane protein YdjX (TVP38/TMEM64 family)
MKHWWLLVLLMLLVGLFFAFDLGRFISFEALKNGRDELQEAYQVRPLGSIGLYALVYIAVAALALPGAGVLSLAAGAIFGPWIGAPLVLLSASAGATLAFWAVRYIFRDIAKRRLGDRMAVIDEGIRRDGVFYLFSLRLVPVLPFFIINLLMGLTAIKTSTFFWVSLLGMAPGTAIFVNAGTQLGKLTSLSGILTPELIGSLALLAIFPWVARWGLESVRRVRRTNGTAMKGKRQAGWPKPRRFDRNLVVIGGGAAGLVASYVAAAARARVTLIEVHKMGGDCLNFGCVPSKALIRSAGFLRQARGSKDLGIGHATVDYDFLEVMARVQRVIKTIEPHDSAERYAKLGVEVIHGNARITSPWMVEVNGKTLTTRAIVIATGSRPVIPALPGLERVRYYTSDTIWSLKERPQRLVVLGGGPIGCELAQAFALLDCQVTQVERSRLMGREDSDAVALVEAALRADGVRVLTQTDALRCENKADKQRLIVRHRNGTEEVIPFDAMLCAVGRVSRTEGFGLEELEIPVSSLGTIETDAWMQTNYPSIYACGDAAGPYQFTHFAGHQAWYASVNALFGDVKRFKVDYSVIPWATFTYPEVARAGLSEMEANNRGVKFEVTRYDLTELDRAVTDEAAHGFVKVLTVPGKDRILGVTIVGDHASDLLAEFVLGMKHGLGLKKIFSTIHIYPTWSEANKYAAGQWRREHMPHRLLNWVAKYHAWRRG